MNPRIENINEKKLVGKRLKMSFSTNKTGELWMEFMPKRSEIKNKLNSSLISLQQYEKDFDFNPNTEFEKWASVEVANFNNIPSGMETFVLPSGLYAVFDYKGLNTDHSIFQYIFGTWLPSSAFVLDNRPLFEVLGDKYKNNDPSSEEEIWIPIRKKNKRSL